MATLGSTQMTMMDQAKIIDPSGQRLMKIVEVLDRETGMILQEWPFLPSNDLWTHKSVRAASMPSGTRRRLNVGIDPSTSRETPVLDVIGGFADYAQYDRAIIDNSPDPAGTRIMKARRHIQGIGQSMISDVLYGDTSTDPDAIQGLAPRMDTVDGEFVIDAGGTVSGVTSIYVVTPGEDMVHLIYPKNMAGTQLGVKHEDKGQVTLRDANNKQYEGYQDYFECWFGLVVADPRCIGRVANIKASGTDNTFNEDHLIALLEEMYTGPSTRIYMNQTLITQARIRAKDKNNMHWTTAGEALAGTPFLQFDGIPVRKIDKRILLNTETVIS